MYYSKKLKKIKKVTLFSRKMDFQGIYKVLIVERIQDNKNNIYRNLSFVKK